MTWKLFLDDVRDSPDDDGWTIARSTAVAIQKILVRGMPKKLSLDHDLGGDDDAMRFLKELYFIWEEKGSDPETIPDYVVHSENPVGTQNIISYMETWKKVYKLD